MAAKELESVKLPTAHVKKVRKNKKETGVPIAVFICQAIDEKLHRQKKPTKMDEADLHLFRRKHDPDYGVKIEKPKGL